MLWIRTSGLWVNPDLISCEFIHQPCCDYVLLIKYNHQWSRNTIKTRLGTDQWPAQAELVNVIFEIKFQHYFQLALKNNGDA